MEEVLGSYALVLTMLMSLAIVVWFCWSIADSLLKMRHRHKTLRYKALIRENERLKSSLADVEEENLRLRKSYYTEVTRRKSNTISRNVA